MISYLIDRNLFSFSNVHEIVSTRMTLTVYIRHNHMIGRARKLRLPSDRAFVQELKQSFTDSEASFTAAFKQTETGALFCRNP